MDIAQMRELISQFQLGARVSTAIGEPMSVGDRIVIPVAEVAYGGGGGGGGGQLTPQETAGSGGGGGGGVHVRPLGCWVIGPDDEIWVPALDINRMVLVGGAVFSLLLLTVRAFARRRR